MPQPAREHRPQATPAPARRTPEPASRPPAPAGVPRYLQGSAAPTIEPAAEAAELAPQPLELKGAADLDTALGERNQAWLAARGDRGGRVRARFDDIAAGTLALRPARHGRPRLSGELPLNHPFFASLAEAGRPQLIVSSDPRGVIGGEVGIAGLSGNRLAGRLREAPELLGLVGFEIPRRFTLVNALSEGRLEVGLRDVGVRLGGAFEGTLNLVLVDGRVDFAAEVEARVRGLEEGRLSLQRDPEGRISGEATLAAALPRNLSGRVTVAWDGSEIRGSGTFGYQGEKFSGEVTVVVLSREAARTRAAGEAATAAPAEGTARRRGRPRELVVFGEGTLQFAFTDWLSGSAQVIVDEAGHLTVIGEIRPQAEYELFPQRDYNRRLFRIEARAIYGLPVVGNVFIFANIGMDAFAKLGPAKLYNIVVAGTYSTDPEQARDFSIRGSLNVSAAAGLRLRGEGGAGLEILDHDIKAGAGINALAGVQGYAEATPVIGYRERTREAGEDRKGEFFIRGELEMAARPFLGLEGDLFVEVDAPWWSPVPDKRWTWPLGGKEWPLGGSLGVKAEIDYVFGSGEWPSIEFGEVDFDADKFLTDLYNDHPAGGGGGEEKPATWKERNSPEAEPPAPSRGGNAERGAPPPQSPARPRVARGSARRSGRPVDPNARTADGRTVREYQARARRRGQAPAETGSPPRGARPEPRQAGDDAEARRRRWQAGVQAVERALEPVKRTGIAEEPLQRLLESVRRRAGFQRLYARKGRDGRWEIYGEMSQAQQAASVPDNPRAESRCPSAEIAEEALPETHVKWEPPFPGYGFGTKMEADPLTKKPPKNGGGSRPTEEGPIWEVLKKRKQGGSTYYIRGHLLSQDLHGPGVWKNMTPITHSANGLHFHRVEKELKNKVKEGAVLKYKVVVHYNPDKKESENDKLLPKIEVDPTATPAEKAVKRQIVQAEKGVPKEMECEAWCKKGNEQIKIISKTIKNDVDRASPAAYQLEGQPRVQYRLEQLNLREPVPPGYQGDAKAIALEAYMELSGIGRPRAEVLYQNRADLTDMTAVERVLAPTRMRRDQLRSWGRDFAVTFDGATRWNLPRSLGED